MGISINMFTMSSLNEDIWSIWRYGVTKKSNKNQTLIETMK